jgi:sterol desaturase/sphingolipid hydroxylase (fatty acid hydroxylase superfamily)
MVVLAAATGFLGSTLGRSIIGLVLLFGLFSIMEWLWPEDRAQPKIRPGYLTDILYFLFLVPFARLIGTIATIIAFVIAGKILPQQHGLLNISSQAPWLQAIEILLLGDIVQYWGHRAFHKIPALWPYHAVHHSSENLDWLAAARVHPIDSFVMKVLVTVPFYFVGFSPNVLVPYVLFLSIYPIYLHANLSWGYGPLGWLIASPTFHRWHHTAEKEGIDKNLAGLFPFVDILFGTYYMPGHASKKYGLAGEHLSNNLFVQLWYPFRRKQRVTA